MSWRRHGLEAPDYRLTGARSGGAAREAPGWEDGSMVVGRRTESSTFFFPRLPNAAAWVDRAWTAPMKTRCRLPSVRHWGCAEHGELPPTRGVGRSSAIVRRLRFPLISSFSFLSLQFLSGLEGLHKWDAPRGLMEGTSVCTGADSMAPFLPNSIERRILPLPKTQEVQAVDGRCEYAAKRCFSVSRPPSLGNSQKSLFPEIFSQLSQPTILINQRLLQRFSFASQLWLRAVGLWSAPTALECRTPANHGNATECRWRCRPLTTGGGLAACAVDAGGSS